MNSERQPLFEQSGTLPDIKWSNPEPGLYVDPAIEELGRYRVYRYCSLPEALQLVRDKSMTFARPTTWPDKHEHWLSEQLFGVGAPFSHMAAHVKCFSYEYGSNALWRTYESSAGVVRLRIDLAEMLGTLVARMGRGRKLYVARARYKDDRHLRGGLKALVESSPKAVTSQAMRALAMKRAGFSYENEIRVALVSSTEVESPSDYHPVKKLDASCIKSILVDPYLPLWQATQIISVLEHFSKRMKGITIQQSAFDKPVDE